MEKNRALNERKFLIFFITTTILFFVLFVATLIVLPFKTVETVEVEVASESPFDANGMYVYTYSDQILLDVLSSFNSIDGFSYWSMNDIHGDYRVSLSFDNDIKIDDGIYVQEVILSGNGLEELIINLYSIKNILLDK